MKNNLRINSTQISKQNLVKSAKLQKLTDQDGGEKSKRKYRYGHVTDQARNRGDCDLETGVATIIFPRSSDLDKFNLICHMN